MPEQKQEGKKFTDTEMDQIKGIQQRYMDIQLAFGQVHVAGIQLEEQLEQLDQNKIDLADQLKNLREEEQTFVASINEKYGDGELDQQTGVFVPNSADK